MIPSGMAVGDGPRRSALRKALRIMVGTENYWNEMGDTMVPDASPVTDRRYWQVAGGLLALVLLAGDSPHPVSPAVIYALLSNVHEQSEPTAAMGLSLGFISQLESSKAATLLPWMIIPPGEDWKTLPQGHRTLLRDLVVGLGLDVSGRHLSVCVVVSDGDSSASRDIKPPGSNPHPVDRGHCYLCNVRKRQLFLRAAI